jgi:hypothetical protein
MDYIESPITDIINKYIYAIIGNSLADTRIIISDGYIFIILYDTAIYRVFAKELDSSLTFGFIGDENNEISDKYKLNNNRLKVDISLCKSKLKSVNIDENVLAKIENVKISDETFDKYVNIKSENGCLFYKLIGYDGLVYYIPIMSRFPKLAKKDDMDIIVYKNINDSESYIIREIIHKASIKSDYDVFFRTIKFS